jgi:hypothetical protein
VRIAAHGDARQAEGEAGTQAFKKLRGTGSTGRGIAQDADLVAAFDLAAGQVEDMTEQAADRRPEDVQDAKARRTVRQRLGDRAGALVRRAALKVQNQRSLMTMVSPGFIG